MNSRTLGALVSVALVVAVLWLFATAGGQSGKGDSTTATESGGSDGVAVAEADGIPPSATEATVEYVHDGDTLFLDDGRKVRMLGIDTPEIGDRAQCFGDEATTLLRAMLPVGTHVWVQPDLEPEDQYGRSLLFVYTADGNNVNLSMLEQGAARVEMYEPNLLLQPQIMAAEKTAMDTGAGLWSQCP